MYIITCIQRPPKGSDHLKQVFFKCRFCLVDFRRGVALEEWSLKAVDCLIQVVSHTGLTVIHIPHIQNFDIFSKIEIRTKLQQYNDGCNLF